MGSMMTSPWTAQSSERVRLLAMLRLADGWSQQFVADFLGVSRRSIRRWRRGFREAGEVGLRRKPGAGRPSKLDHEQAARVLSWVEQDASDFGFATERWSAPRVASLIEQNFGVCFNARYLNDWFRRH